MGYRQHMGANMGNIYPYNGYPAARYPSPYQRLGYGSNPNMAYNEHYPGYVNNHLRNILSVWSSKFFVQYHREITFQNISLTQEN